MASSSSARGCVGRSGQCVVGECYCLSTAFWFASIVTIYVFYLISSPAVYFCPLVAGTSGFVNILS